MSTHFVGDWTTHTIKRRITSTSLSLSHAHTQKHKTNNLRIRTLTFSTVGPTPSSSDLAPPLLSFCVLSQSLSLSLGKNKRNQTPQHRRRRRRSRSSKTRTEHRKTEVRSQKNNLKLLCFFPPCTLQSRSRTCLSTR